MNQIGAINSSNYAVKKKNESAKNLIAGAGAGMIGGALYLPLYQLTNTAMLTAKHGKKLGYMNMIKAGFENMVFYMKGHAYKVLHNLKLPTPKTANKTLLLATAAMAGIFTAVGLGIGALANVVSNKTNKKSS